MFFIKKIAILIITFENTQLIQPKSLLLLIYDYKIPDVWPIKEMYIRSTPML